MMAAKLKYPANQNIRDLPGKIMIEVRDALDTRSVNNVSAWRAFASRLKGRFHYKAQDVERLAQELHKGGSPSSQMLMEVGAKAMETSHLVELLDELHLEDVLSLLVEFEEVKITVQPERYVKVKEGQQILVSTHASGFPYPRYLWYRFDPKLEESVATAFTQSSLRIDQARPEHSGDYCCLVYNSPQSGCFTDWCSIVVQPSPRRENAPSPHQDSIVALPPLPQADGKAGATESEYRVYNINNRGMAGVYMCLVSNDHNGQVLSKGAVLQIGEMATVHNHFATDKVALLIGNYDYRSQQSLKAPQTDIQNLSHIFQRVLGFKVVSLLNLTLTEMMSAVEEFCELIDSGVYCVFYFCGHGFEEDNHSYILPNDVPTDYKTEECLSADFVLHKMQQCRPKVCCMILDICRKPAENPNQGRRGAIIEHVPVEDGNTIVCYATSCGLAAFEFRPQSKGILVTHLEKLLPQPISIEEVFRKVKEAVGNDSRVNQNARTRQIPEVRSNLIEVHRSFTDPIETTGHTRACNKRQLAWENAHVKPPPMEVCLNPIELGVVVELTFQHEFSNVLNVFIKVIRKGNLPHCIAWISKLPSSVSMMKKPTCVTAEGAELTMTKNVIIDIQKLKENLRVSLAMRYCLPGSQPYDYIISKDTQIDLQLPLVAGLKLWSPRPIQPSTMRHAVEQTEEDKVDA